MTPAALSFDGVSKLYKGGRDYSALRDELTTTVSRLWRGARPPQRVVHALENVSFDVSVGESCAIMGDNGAGKTTALKLATRIAYPTTGRIRVRGRVGALIEVGTGMHPELTGRENIQLYGRILGLTGRDIARRFDHIVEFAALGPSIDQPVKQYSSGMQLRLGFSVAAHLEPDILLVDEAIAVGDAGFQHRCMERMGDLVREGRTLIFVSHDMQAIETLCSRAIRVDHGRVVADGPAPRVVAGYLEAVHDERMATAATRAKRITSSEELEVLSVSLLGADGRDLGEVQSGGPVTVRIKYRAAGRIVRPDLCVAIGEGGSRCFSMAHTSIDGQSPPFLDGTGAVDCTFESLPLRPRIYEIWGAIAGETGGALVPWQRLCLMKVTAPIGGGGRAEISTDAAASPVLLPYRWDFGNTSSPDDQ